MNILIVEDDFRIGEMYKEYLSEHTKANEINSVINASTALEFLKTHDVDIVIIDIYLPDMMGDVLAEEILKNYPYINFICISANQSSDIIKNLFNLGVLYYLIKPVKLEKLGEVVNQFIKTNKVLAEPRNLDQDQIDAFFISQTEVSNDELPKGIDPLSLEKIRASFDVKDEWSSSELGEKLGTSRTTVRRYLEYLKDANYLTVTQEFGDKGRPEKRYRR